MVGKGFSWVTFSLISVSFDKGLHRRW
jgi:hypothetical protein